MTRVCCCVMYCSGAAVMGYEITRFEGEVDEELLCPICSGVLEDPVQVSGYQKCCHAHTDMHTHTVNHKDSRYLAHHCLCSAG